MTLDSLVFMRRKIHHYVDNSMILFYTGGGFEYGVALGVIINMIGAFNVDFECHTHNADMFELKYLPNSPLGDFLPMSLLRPNAIYKF